jgi:NAD(P)-dependent dehydrogenase (short-subunit alcohol dehydrogenase family)
VSRLIPASKENFQMNDSFQNKVALVTGAGSGMGLTTAKAFAAAGAAVALLGDREDEVRAAADELTRAGHKALAIRCNVADEQQVEAAVAKTAVTFGRLDAAFNNAGVQSPVAETADASSDEFDRVNGINLRGVWNLHEVRAAPDAQAGQRRDSEQFLNRRSRRDCRPRRLSRLQAWRARPHQKRLA